MHLYVYDLETKYEHPNFSQNVTIDFWDKYALNIDIDICVDYP